MSAEAIWNAAQANTGVDFAIVDSYWEETYPSNLRGMVFDIEELGYLAGALAGLMTQTDTIGVIGGMPIPPVDGFINGYRNGAQRANPQVQVLVEYTYDWVSVTIGEDTAQNLIDQSADVIFNVAEPAGSAGIRYAAQQGVWVVGIDMDEYYTTFGGGSVAGSDKLLTSAIKEIELAVFDTIQDEVNGAFRSGTLVYNLTRLSSASTAMASVDLNYTTLADMIGLAPFHEANASIPTEEKTELETVHTGLVDGTIDASFSGHVYLPISLKNLE